MRRRKQHQPPLSIDEQIKNLQEKGLIINDEQKAKSILNDISYYRLIKGYSLNLKEKNGNYHDSVTFHHILELYLFNANFRQIIFPQIEKIEVNVRCRISNFFVCKYGVLGYKDAIHFLDEKHHKHFIEYVEEEVSRNAKNPFVKNFQEKYLDGEIPFYAVVEIITFGALSKFYKNMKNEDKKIIAKSFGIGYAYLESWLECISYVRNICAHYGRLYGANLVKRPIIYKEYRKQDINNDKIFAVLLCMKLLLSSDRHWNLFVDEIHMLIDKYEEVDIKKIGFPENWVILLQQKYINNE